MAAVVEVMVKEKVGVTSSSQDISFEENFELQRDIVGAAELAQGLSKSTPDGMLKTVVETLESIVIVNKPTGRGDKRIYVGALSELFKYLRLNEHSKKVFKV